MRLLAACSALERRLTISACNVILATQKTLHQRYLTLRDSREQRRLRYRISTERIFVVCACALVFLTTAAAPAEAQSIQFTGATTLVSSLVDLLTGTFGKSVATLGLVCCGLIICFGRPNWIWIGCVGLGCACVFGGKSFINSVASALGAG